MNESASFIGFLESLKTASNESLIESIEIGYGICMESVDTSDENFIHTHYGYCYYTFNPEGYNGAAIYNLYVEPSFRKGGNARRLLELAISEIRRSGYSGDIGIVAEPREDSINRDDLTSFYKRMGLTIIEDSNGDSDKSSLYESDTGSDTYEIPRIEPTKSGNKTITTDIPPEKRTWDNIPKKADGHKLVKFQDWLCIDTIHYNNGTIGKGSDGKWYGWSHRAVYGFEIGDKIKKGDVVYNGKEYTIKTEQQAKDTAARFSDGVS